MYDIVYIGDDDNNWKKLKQRFVTAKRVDSIDKAKAKVFTKMFWTVCQDIVPLETFNFNYEPDDWSRDFIHVFKNKDYFDGICLVPKSVSVNSQEFQKRTFKNKKEVDILASCPKEYQKIYVDDYDDYIIQLTTVTSDFVWIIPNDVRVNFDFNYQIPYWDKDFVHVFKNNDFYDGVMLHHKNKYISRQEYTDRIIKDKKEVDIIASVPKSFDIFEISSYEEYLTALKETTTDLFWMSSPNISIDKSVIENFYISKHNEIDRNQNHSFLHKTDQNSRLGLYLCSKFAPVTKNEIEYRHIVNRKEWDIVASRPIVYDAFDITSYEEYLDALEKSKTEMFWITFKDVDASNFEKTLYFDHDNVYDRNINHTFIHNDNGTHLRNGVWLCTKNLPLTKREVEYRFVVNAKEHDTIASVRKYYDKFSVNSYKDYKQAFDSSTQEMFWAIADNYIIINEDIFDTYFPKKHQHDEEYDYELSVNHIYKNGIYNDGVMLCSKKAEITEREWNYGFIVNKKECETVASQPNPYDIVFISYQEPTADKNYNKLLERFPRAKRIHGVKGIHQAHIEAAKLCNTDMIWIVDGDAEIVDDFDFDYQVPLWKKDNVFVWRSQNPINDLVYGYGGVKLFPRKLTIEMDTTKPDMTTSITSKFNPIQEISNITAFNTGPFETWKSAFRECAKLSSKIIDRQKNEETEQRLEAWCTVGEDRPYGSYAIAGARAGREFGLSYRDDLKLINDFDWLKEKFDGENNEG